MTSLNRRRFVLSNLATMHAAQSGASFGYRGFIVDISAAQNLPNLSAILRR